MEFNMLRLVVYRRWNPSILFAHWWPGSFQLQMYLPLSCSDLTLLKRTIYNISIWLAGAEEAHLMVFCQRTLSNELLVNITIRTGGTP